MNTLSGIGMTSRRTRERMVAKLREEGIRDEVVLAAMNAVPRHIFVDEALSIRAYENIPLPIGFNQTISQPWVVARMTELLRNGRNLGRVLEVGTGCGYQTAILAQVAQEVYSVERLRPLLEKAKKHFRELKLTNVKVKHADGNLGLPEMAPYDGILVTCGATHIPEALLQQLAVGGRMVIPVGAVTQVLTVIDRTEHGYQRTELEPVVFVPLLGGLG
jgi:protein-L-isoaspartate(D-aspartate) O-methyltransferase